MEIYFDDDTFAGNKKHALETTREIIRRDLRIPWSRIGDAIVTDTEMISMMAESGCVGMKSGVKKINAGGG
ncbi:MAG: hypothetical protein HZA01_10795 [Nitrospinae bacterium]|nr:hypothetical protein [Nitrospinota bacterium]